LSLALNIGYYASWSLVTLPLKRRPPRHVAAGHVSAPLLATEPLVATTTLMPLLASYMVIIHATPG